MSKIGGDIIELIKTNKLTGETTVVMSSVPIAKEEKEAFSKISITMEIENKNGAYDLEGIIWHQHSNKLLVAILELWPDKIIPVVDLGCGHNFYCSVLEYTGYMAAGVDGVNLKGVDAIADITNAFLTEEALRDLYWFNNYQDSPINIISLEVGEHLPSHLSDAYLNNLTSFGGDIIMSWAIPGQAGIGHINCQSNEWVMEEMAKRGYQCDFNKTTQMRIVIQGDHCSWFANTLMYFYPSKS